jgi:hypothetical protein
MDSDVAVKALVDRGYRLVTTPIRVGDVSVDFDAALVGPEDERHLILMQVAPTGASPIVRRIRALLATLEHAQSTRPVSLVLIADKEPPYVGQLQRHCPVYWYRPGDDAAVALKALFPLTLPTARTQSRSAEIVLKRRLRALSENALTKALLTAAADSPGRVHETLRKALDKAAEIEGAQ